MLLPFPWQPLPGLMQVTVRSHRDGPMGRATYADQSVSLRADLTAAERRCTLLHELLHLDNGPQPRGLRAKEEEQVRRATARMMLPRIEPVAEALAWANLALDEAADELGVDVYVLRKRLRHLQPSERRYLRRRLASAGAT